MLNIRFHGQWENNRKVKLVPWFHSTGFKKFLSFSYGEVDFGHFVCQCSELESLNFNLHPPTHPPLPHHNKMYSYCYCNWIRAWGGKENEAVDRAEAKGRKGGARSPAELSLRVFKGGKGVKVEGRTETWGC